MDAQTHYKLQALEQRLAEIERTDANYRFTHKLAKAITCIIINVLNIIVSVLTSLPLIVIVLISLQITVWFFGVNTIAYLIESVLNYDHTHEVL